MRLELTLPEWVKNQSRGANFSRGASAFEMARARSRSGAAIPVCAFVLPGRLFEKRNPFTETRIGPVKPPFSFQKRALPHQKLDQGIADFIPQPPEIGRIGRIEKRLGICAFKKKYSRVRICVWLAAFVMATA